MHTHSRIEKQFHVFQCPISNWIRLPFHVCKDLTHPRSYAHAHTHAHTHTHTHTMYAYSSTPYGHGQPHLTGVVSRASWPALSRFFLRVLNMKYVVKSATVCSASRIWSVAQLGGMWSGESYCKQQNNNITKTGQSLDPFPWPEDEMLLLTSICTVSRICQTLVRLTAIPV